jgi:hypothetical protein
MDNDEKLYAEIRAAQAVAVEKLQARWGMSADQVATARAAIAAPTPNTATAENLATAWARSAEHQARSLGIEPVSDAEAVQIQEAQAAAVAKLRAEQVAQLDDHLHNFRSEWDRGQTDPSSIYYRADPAMRRRMEADFMLVRLEAGLPAEPPPRKTPVQIAQERYDARRKAQS